MKKVLVLDDDLDILKLVQTILKINNFDVQVESEWQRIYTAVESFAPDVILLDISLGGADGVEICKKLKQNPETSNISILLFSANIEMAKRVSDCGAQGYLSKPFTIKELIQAINTSIN
ncbi:MAG: response regulator [Bacteroidota bacterium]